MHGPLYNWDIKAWKTGGAEYEGMLHSFTSSSRVLALLWTENKVTVQNVFGFCPISSAHPLHAYIVEALCREGEYRSVVKVFFL